MAQQEEFVKCNHCGSTDGYWSLTTVIQFQLFHNNGDMTGEYSGGGPERIVIRKRKYCKNCDKIIGKSKGNKKNED